ncbi:BofC C-terminal domain-containing protein [Halobacillus sp. KGW1]|uniref:BofC C-terminal domain-containing protein n=1 Tax=Halobacillus sp. KGW1 TaxID=1793726 RepID=UPI0007820222|nr:BofC C-terminal domain-containing protein [Halobacillus sp. KGW1]
MKRLWWAIGISLLLVGWQGMENSSDRPLKAEDHPFQRNIDGKVSESSTEETRVQVEPLTLIVVLKKHYRDGVTETTQEEETIWSMPDFWAEYAGWTVEEQEVGKIVFQRQVEDISPLTKSQGYFGLNKDGELAVFQGLPDHGEVIESFKPVPVKPLESKYKNKLKTGIKIKDFRHFEQVVQRVTEEEHA